MVNDDTQGTPERPPLGCGATNEPASKEELLKPLRDLVLVQLNPTKQSSSGIREDGSTFTLYLPGAAQHEQPLGRVVAIGPDVNLPGLRPGLTVLIDESRAIRAGDGAILKVGKSATGNTLGRNGPGRVLVGQADVIAIIGKD